MLVKKSIVEKWYQTDSWVYQNFAFLFQNPLWNKRIPRGFSVCPYFWLNLFSIFIFRPFLVWPIQYFFRPILNLLGKPGAAIDTFLFNGLKRIGLVRGDYFPGSGVIASFAYLTIAILLLFVGVVGVGAIFKFYPYITGSNLGMFAFWSITSFLSLFGVIVLHKKLTNTECKTMSYLYIWLVGFIVIAPFFISTEIGIGIATLIRAFGEVFSIAGIGIWSVICFCAKWVWFGLMWAPIDVLVVPWWTYLLTVGGIGWVASYISGNDAAEQINSYREQTTEEFWDRNRQNWVSLFYRLLTANKYWDEGKVFRGEYSTPNWNDGMFDSSDRNKACHSYRQTIFRRALELMFAEQLEKLKTTYPLIKHDQWTSYTKKYSVDFRFALINRILDGIEAPDLNFNQSNFQNAIRDAIETPNIKVLVDSLMDQYRHERAEAATKKANAKQSWSHIACLRVTTTINQCASRTGRGLKWLVVQCGTILAYLWILIKAKKQGACPYLTFSEPVKLPPQAPSSQATNSPNNPKINLNFKN